MTIKISSLLAVVATALAAPALQAQNATTIPVGVVTVDIAAGTGTVYTQTAFSAPLLQAGNLTGQVVGRITGVTNNTLSNANAGWANSTMAIAGSPHFVHITSGNASGRMFQIGANDQTSLTLVNTQGVDLTTLGIVTNSTGDTYEIVTGDTLSGILGTPSNGIIGGNSTAFNQNLVDKISINDPNTSSVFTYFWNTAPTSGNLTAGYRRLGNNNDQGNLVVSPRAGIHFARIANSNLTLSFTGTVPSKNFQQQVARGGTTILSQFYPTDSTLGSLGIQDMTGWKAANRDGVTIATSDRVVIKFGSSFFSYFYNWTAAGGPRWERQGLSGSQGTVPVTAGSAIRLVRTGSASEFDTWNRAIPYNLN